MSDSTRQPQKSGEFELDLGRLGLVVIVPVACWAFYTTFQGLKDVTRQGGGDIIGLVGAVIGAGAILSLLALSSWHLGTDAAAVLAGRPRSRSAGGGLFVILPAFLFFFSLSTFFSYTYYHSNFFGLSSRQIEGERQPRALAATVLSALDEPIRSEKEKVKATAVAAGGDWLKGTDALIKVAGEGGNRFEALYRAKRQAAEEAARKSAAEEKQRIDDAQSASQQLEQLQREINNQQVIVDAGNSVIGPEEQKIATLRKDIDAETEKSRLAERGVDESKKSGCGKICEGHKAKAAQYRAEAEKIDRALKDPRARRDQAVKKSNELRGKLPDLERRAATKSTGLADAAPTPPVAPNVKAELAALTAARDSFQSDPSGGTIAGAERSCRTLLATAQELNAALDIPAGFDCTIRTDTAKRAVETWRIFRRTENEWRQKCALNANLGTTTDDISSRVRSKTLAPAEGLVEARRVVEQCVASATLLVGGAAALDGAYNAIDTFIRNQSLDRNRFTSAVSALWRFDGDARLALAVALAQDLLILIYKLLADFYKHSMRPRRITSLGPVDLSDDDADPSEIRARKAILRLAKPGRGDSSRLAEEDVKREKLPEHVLSNLWAVLNSYGRQELVWQTRKGTYGIDNRALHDIEVLLHQILHRREPVVAGNGQGRPIGTMANNVAPTHVQSASSVEERIAGPGALPKRDASSPTRKRRSVRDFASDRSRSADDLDSGEFEPSDATRRANPRSEMQPSAEAQGISHEDALTEGHSPRHTFDDLRNFKD